MTKLLNFVLDLLLAGLLSLGRQALCFAERERFLLDTVQCPVNSAGFRHPVLFDGGVTNRDRATHPFGKVFPWSDFVSWNIDEDDFSTRYLAADWTITKIGAGTSQALIAGDGGQLAIINSAGANDGTAYQRTVGAFVLDLTKPFIFGARFMVDSPTLTDVIMGLQAVTTTPFTDPTDGIWFKKAAASTMDFIVRGASVSTTAAAAVPALTANTFVSVEFAYDGRAVFYSVNGTIVGQSVPTNIPIVTALTPSFAVRNNASAVAHTLTVDYFIAGKGRATLAQT